MTICKKDDIAFVKKALRPKNIDKVVTVKTYLGYYERAQPYVWNGETFLAFDSDDHWIIECNSGLETQFGSSLQAVIMDSWLFPIRGDEQEDFEDNKELIDGDLVDA